jgi:ribA/ribD-fused uncharacterized protein
VLFDTVDHYYYWSQFTDPIIRKRILLAPTTSIIRQIVDKNTNKTIPNFNRLDTMRNALKAKFTQNNYLYTELKSTAPHILINHNLLDTYWGDGGDGSGVNKLGQLLTEIRTDIINNILTTDNPFIKTP